MARQGILRLHLVVVFSLHDSRIRRQYVQKTAGTAERCEQSESRSETLREKEENNRYRKSTNTIKNRAERPDVMAATKNKSLDLKTPVMSAIKARTDPIWL
jgi:replication initiation and membrane attachment protein DnaB